MVDTNRQIIDLSVDVDPSFWEPEPVNRKVLNHKDGADRLGRSYLFFNASNFLKRLWFRLARSKKYYIDHNDFPDRMGLSSMTYTLTTHTGTHIDAPYHYGWRTTDNGKRKTVTDIPLSWCYGPGVLLNFSQPNSNQNMVIDRIRVEEELKRIKYDLQSGDIVLINTGAYKKLGLREYFTNYQAIEKSAVEWLVQRGVRVIGTDAFSFDQPFCNMIDEYKQTGDNSALWPAHFFGRDHEYIQIERLGNLDNLPKPFGFEVCCFPIKLTNADAAWSRVVAIL